jgi:ATP-dependent Clp protease ATP-binding subunit ClpC
VEFVDPDADAQGADEPAAVPAAHTAMELPSLILAPTGTAAEFEALRVDYEDAERVLASAEWEELKAKLSGEMGSAEFWNRPDRFGVLARLALIDRVKAAAETANALLGRLMRHSHSMRRTYSIELSRRLALQLYLVRQGIQDVFDDLPVELALTVEPIFDHGSNRQATLGWCRKLTGMYRAWASKRRMHVEDLPGATDHDAPILLVSGFGAYRTLAREAGLHIFEPSESDVGRVTAGVRYAVVPLGDVPASKTASAVVRELERTPRHASVVRRYREQPPLVRDGEGKWRTGRLDLVLGGEFDLLGVGRR